MIQPIATSPDPAFAAPRLSSAARGEFLRLELGSGRAVETVGRLERLAEAPADGWAFYCNDFDLADPKPWIVPERIQFSQPPREAAPRDLGLVWEEPALGDFAGVFGEICGQIRSGALMKAVPVTAARTRWTDAAREAARSRCFQPRGDVGSHAYAWQLDGRGAAGLTPETLFRVEGGMLRAMALAGTAPAGRERELETNDKLHREHQMVVQSIVERLAPLGELRCEPRRVMPLNSMAHLCTKISVALDDPCWERRAADLVALLHPTPALGVAPRTPETLASLREWRRRAGAPAHFGAPLGVKWPGGMLMLVAIRGVFWEGDQACLPAGVGVVEGSSLEAEWEELQLKRRWVRQALHC